MTPSQWLPIDLLVLLGALVGTVIAPFRWIRWMGVASMVQFAFWIGWNLSQTGCR